MTSGLVRIADGPLEVELLPSVGARLHRLRAFGTDLLRTPANVATHADDPLSWGGYLMAPWGGRIEAVPTTVGDRLVTVAPNFPDGSAIHGQVAAIPWEVTGPGTFRARRQDDGWPWPYEIRLCVSVRDATLRIRSSLVNLADRPMPAGLGLHPWFVGPIDVGVRGGAVFPSNSGSSPLPEPVAGDLDLRVRRPMPANLDATWVDLGDPAVELRWPALGIEATMAARSSAGGLCIVGASPAALDAVAIEPQTHGPQGLRRLLRGEPFGLATLESGEALGLTIEIAFRR